MALRLAFGRDVPRELDQSRSMRQQPRLVVQVRRRASRSTCSQRSRADLGPCRLWA